MMLSDGELLRHMQSGDIGIYGPGDVTKSVQPCSIDLHLGAQIKRQIHTGYSVSLKNPPQFDTFNMERNDPKMWIYPGEFYLGHTQEVVTIPDDMVAELHGKSSWGRIGLMVHSTAGHIDPGFTGQVTLEMRVIGVDPIELSLGDPIAQICIARLGWRAQRPYGKARGSHYQGQQGAQEVVVR